MSDELTNLDSQSLVTADAWRFLGEFTSARIAMGRAGGSLPTREVLRFALDHAAARDAVEAEFHADAIAEQIRLLGLETIVVDSEAGDLATYLKRPDLGRRLSLASRQILQEAMPADGCDVAIIVGDGLSALAVERHACQVLRHLLVALANAKQSVGPIAVVRHARVAIEDEVGELLRVRLAVILIGERPGLGTPDSLGAYLVYDPKIGRTDAERNCVSNIHAKGLAPKAAAETLRYLIRESLQRKISGVELKDERMGLTDSVGKLRIEQEELARP